MSRSLSAAVPDGPSSPRSSDVAHTAVGFGDGRPFSRATAPQDLPFILGVKEAARWLGIHHDTLRGHASSGKVPCLRIGNRLCFRRDVLLDVMERAGRSK